MDDDDARDSESEAPDNEILEDYIRKDGDRKDFFDEDELTNAVTGSTKKLRKNTKPVECLDLAGNIIGVFQSGIAAVKALGVQQGDISLCCRGLKDSINGYRFRFVGDGDHTRAGAVKNDDDRFTRLTRNRVESVLDKGPDKQTSLLAPREIKVCELITRVFYIIPRIINFIGF